MTTATAWSRTDLIRAHPEVQVVLLTGYADALLMPRAARPAASALMAKDGSLPDLLTALRSRRRVARRPSAAADGAGQRRPETAAGRRPVSPRERDVLGCSRPGHDVRMIARRLGISINTCRGYVKTLLRKLDAHSQLEAVAVARAGASWMHSDG